MHCLYSVVEYNGNPILAKIVVEEYGNGSRRAYNVSRIKMSALSREEYIRLKRNTPRRYASSADIIGVADLVSLVKRFDKKIIPER